MTIRKVVTLLRPVSCVLNPPRDSEFSQHLTSRSGTSIPTLIFPKWRWYVPKNQARLTGGHLICNLIRLLRFGRFLGRRRFRRCRPLGVHTGILHYLVDQLVELCAVNHFHEWTPARGVAYHVNRWSVV